MKIPSSPTLLAKFSSHVGVSSEYSLLHEWSICNRESFWGAIWDFCGVIGTRQGSILNPGTHPIHDRWFSDSTLNFAENLLQPASLSTTSSQADVAMICISESASRSPPKIEEITRVELIVRVEKMANYLQKIGIQPGDRVAALLPNTAAAVVGMLATVAIGAIWSCCSPDFGDDAICDRFQQIEPKVLITAEQCRYNGKVLSPANRIRALLRRLPSVRSLLVDCMDEAQPAHLNGDNVIDQVSFQSILETGIDASNHIPFDYQEFPFNQPAFILYSSGTTGKPKCIVHGAGGTLLQHLKEHQLHCDLRAGDRMLYYTTTGWMMWNWLVSGLASGATIVLYDGNPLYPNDTVLFELLEQLDITHFGTSAKFLSAIEKRGCVPNHVGTFAKLRTVLSTGSPLSPESFDYVYSSIKSDVHLASISGGTDIISCFVLGNPDESVHRGEIQRPGLGMDVQVWDDSGSRLFDAPGELVCLQSFPSMPVGFWNDDDHSKYLGSYYARYPNVWCHGDWAQQQSDTHGWVIHGRSDATLNPGGIRIGTAEIYQQVERFTEIAEALAVPLRRNGDEEIVLFVRMQSGKALDETLIRSVAATLRQNLSPRHVPHHFVEVPDFPRTISGKMSEIAVRRCINSQAVANHSALANPEILAFFEAWQPTG